MKTSDRPGRSLLAARYGNLEIKVAHSAQDGRRAKAALGRAHGLGAGRQAGDRLGQLVFEGGQLVAVMVWCAAAWHLQARDQTVGGGCRHALPPPETGRATAAVFNVGSHAPPEPGQPVPGRGAA